jgi:membrane-bound lytic murein transglycosylase D
MKISIYPIRKKTLPFGRCKEIHSEVGTTRFRGRVSAIGACLPVRHKSAFGGKDTSKLSNGVYRYIVLLLGVLLIFGCALPRGPIVNNQNNKPRDVPSSTENIVNDGKGNSELITYVEESNNVKEENGENEQNLLDTALDFSEASQEFWSEGNLEQALEALDQAYTLILKVDTDKHPKMIQQKEDLRFVISKRILEIYASRYTAVSGNHKAIPLTMNKHVEKEIKQFQGVERKFFIESYKRSGRYTGKIVKALKEAGLPEELSWLPLIESGFKVRALSRARALGLWQFIPSTGYKYGLKRDTWIDERLDPGKSTAAAIAYLEELHNIFGDWTTVLAGYNCGEGRVLRVIRNQKINYLDNFWDLYENLPRETARYVPRFLATLHILKDPAKYGFTLEEIEEPVSYDVITIEKPVLLKAVADKLGVALKELTELNPELRRKTTPGTPYSLKVPVGTGEVLLAKLDEIPKWSPPRGSYAYHRVRKGETLSLIALKYRTSIRAIVRANNIQKRHFIRVGQKLKIPLRRGVVGKAYASKPKLLPGGRYRIKKGDSLWLIAKKFNTNTKTLMQINNLRSTRLYVGQTLKITK